MSDLKLNEEQSQGSTFKLHCKNERKSLSLFYIIQHKNYTFNIRYVLQRNEGGGGLNNACMKQEIYTDTGHSFKASVQLTAQIQLDLHDINICMGQAYILSYLQEAGRIHKYLQYCKEN